MCDNEDFHHAEGSYQLERELLRGEPQSPNGTTDVGEVREECMALAEKLKLAKRKIV